LATDVWHCLGWAIPPIIREKDPISNPKGHFYGPKKEHKRGKIQGNIFPYQ
jgi:hypothetical protein